MTEYIVFAHKTHEPAYYEKVVLETTDRTEAMDIAYLYITNGYHARIMTYNGEAPNFIAAINI